MSFTQYWPSLLLPLGAFFKAQCWDWSRQDGISESHNVMKLYVVLTLSFFLFYLFIIYRCFILEPSSSVSITRGIIMRQGFPPWSYATQPKAMQY